MKLKRKLASFVVAGIMAVMSCGSLVSSAAIPYKNMDANDDGNVAIGDAVYILQYLSGCFEPTNPERCDVDKNGIISPIDAYIIQYHFLGIEVEDDE
ncbi:MAG: dockerin type I repeat-containing protein [Ruminococcus sp.]|nr:dockerin type I repeat-containing protein [Ruminococcus sp.]